MSKDINVVIALLNLTLSLILIMLSKDASASSLPRLQVSENKRFIVQSDGKPLFLQIDTAWRIVSVLQREDVDIYLETRKKQGFTAIQFWLMDYVNSGPLYINAKNAYGIPIFNNSDSSKINPAFFKHVDYIIDKAASLGIYVGIAPLFGDARWLFTTTSVYNFCYWLGTHYRDKTNIFWIMGGDRDMDTTWQKYWRTAAKAIVAGVARKPQSAELTQADYDKVFMTFHPLAYPYTGSSSHWFHNDKWLDFNGFQSGHYKNNPVYKYITNDYNLAPPKPVIDLEPWYDDMPEECKNIKVRGNSYDIRKEAYWAVFAGAAGHGYGANGCWNFDHQWYPGFSLYNWTEAINFESAWQLQYVRKLVESRPYLTRIPDQKLIINGKGLTVSTHVQATRDGTLNSNNATYIMVYIPDSNHTVTINTAKIPGDTLNIWKYNPRNGVAELIDTRTNSGTYVWTTPPNGPDWVLVIDDVSKNYPPPGITPHS